MVEWDASRGAFPADKPYALSHWAKDAGHRQLCGDISGQVVIDFVKKYPKEDTQEPGALSPPVPERRRRTFPRGESSAPLAREGPGYAAALVSGGGPSAG